MAKRGRVSQEALSVAGLGNVVALVQRAKPPAHLSKEAAEEWKAIVDRLPPEWFSRETWPLLENYCNSAVSLRKITKAISKMESAGIPDIKKYKLHCNVRATETRTMAMLATRMRISQHSSYDKQKRKTLQAGQKPWQA